MIVCGHGSMGMPCIGDEIGIRINVWILVSSVSTYKTYIEKYGKSVSLVP
jgi:hypothetical protein